jgi:hypothetical protein
MTAAILTTENLLAELIDATTSTCAVSDTVVKRLIEFHKKLEDVAQEGGMIKGWHPLRFDTNGRVIAGKIVNGVYRTNDFEPVGSGKRQQSTWSWKTSFGH